MRQESSFRPVYSQDGAGADGENKAATPIDTSHLAKQTMNDPDLQREVLQIFVEQLEIARREVPAAEGEQRARLAHKLKGAAHAVGALPLARCAERLMEQPDDAEALSELDGLAEDARAFAASLAG